MDRRSLLRFGSPGLADDSPGSSASGCQSSPGVYVTSNDALSIVVYPNITCSVQLNYRFTRLDGTVVFGSGTLQFTSGAPAQLQLPLEEGYLTAVEAWGGYPPNVLRGDAFAVVSIPSMVLFQDYLQTNLSEGWPGGRQLSSVEGPGALDSLIVPNAAAGQDWQFQVPSNARWLLHSARMQLTTSSVNKQRLVYFVVDQGLHGQFAAAALQPPGTMVFYQLARGSGSTSVAPNWSGKSNYGFTLIPAGLPFPLLGGTTRGSTIGTTTIGLDAGDQWAAIVLMYEQWYQASP